MDAPGFAGTSGGAGLQYASHPRCIVQAGRFAFPSCCTLCLSEHAHRRFKLPLTPHGDDIPLPLCEACHAQILRRAWRYTLTGLCIALATALLVWAVPWADERLRSPFAIVAGLVIGIFAACVIPDWRLRPYRSRIIDGQRGVIEFWFANPEYGRRLMDDYRRRESDVRFEETREETMTHTTARGGVIPT